MQRGFSAEEFIKIWTLKESYIKEAGKGLSILLEYFSFDLTDDVMSVYDQYGVRNGLQFQIGQIENGYCYAVCAACGEGMHGKIQVVSMQELMDFA